ncbi:MAG: putative rane protein [Nocardioidaceae bacterium]|jgi:cytochrome c oxidase assembly factor CtaG|nr:putative rane protein [Nocardioidaceae bacterium]
MAQLLAHGDEAESIGWAVQTGPLVGLLIAAAAYALLVAAAARRGQPVPLARTVSFYGGLAVVGLALFSPLDPFGESQSVSAHMLQHELLLMVAPLLLVAGVDQRVTVPVTRRVLGPALRTRAWRVGLAVVGHPVVVTVAWCAMVLGWHVPVFYDLALDNDTVHIVEHSCLLTVGLGFWAVVIGRLPSVHRTTAGQRVGALGVAMAASGALGAILLWAPRLLYPEYAEGQPWFGLTALHDQRFAGALMMAVDMPLLLGAAVFATARWARQEARLTSHGRQPLGVPAQNNSHAGPVPLIQESMADG